MRKKKIINKIFSQTDPSIDFLLLSEIGSGLTLSNQLVRTLGGKMSVESELGKGSQFSFTAILGISKKEVTTPGGEGSSPSMTDSPALEGRESMGGYLGIRRRSSCVLRKKNQSYGTKAHKIEYDVQFKPKKIFKNKDGNAQS